MTNLQQPNAPEIFKEKPIDFNSKVYVTAAYVKVNDLVLFLQLSNEKSEPGKWGVPAGKLEAGELPEQAVLRELWEETGIKIEKNIPVVSMGEIFIRKKSIDYIYHLFSIELNAFPDVVISQEHTNYKWVTAAEILTLPLMEGALGAYQVYNLQAAVKTVNHSHESI